MNTFKILGIAFIAASLLTFTSCEKASEEVDNHEANYPHSSVKSENVTVYSYEWSGDEYLYEVTKSISIISSSVAESGAVLCYLKSEDQYIQMPYTISLGPDYWTTHVFFAYKAGSITFQLFDNESTIRPDEQITFKVVTIENYTEAKSMGVDFNNYQEVKTTFNLE